MTTSVPVDVPSGDCSLSNLERFGRVSADEGISMLLGKTYLELFPEGCLCAVRGKDYVILTCCLLTRLQSFVMFLGSLNSCAQKVEEPLTCSAHVN